MCLVHRLQQLSLPVRDDTSGLGVSLRPGDMDDDNLKDLSSEEREALMRVMHRAKVSLWRRLSRSMRSSAAPQVSADRIVREGGGS